MGWRTIVASRERSLVIISPGILKQPVGHLRGEQFFYENNSKGIPTVKILRYFTSKQRHDR
jgi:hypothetical protein